MRGYSACFVVRGFKGVCPLARLCSQSVVCYTLCRRCCENAVAAGEGKGILRQENRAVIAWRGAASAGLVSSADRAYMNAPVPRPTPNYGTKCPRRIATLTKKQTDFSLKIEMGGEAILGLSRLDCPLAKTGGSQRGRRNVTPPKSWTRKSTKGVQKSMGKRIVQ